MCLLFPKTPDVAARRFTSELPLPLGCQLTPHIYIQGPGFGAIPEFVICRALQVDGWTGGW